MFFMVALADSPEIFNRLKLLPGYYTTGEEMDRTKTHLLNSFWAREAPRLQREFYPAGIKKDKDGQNIYGLGFILELLAERSSHTGLEPNSEKGNLIARELLGMLSSGDQRYGLKSLQANPDILWLRLVRNQIRIEGLGEVKTSLTAFRRKPEQVRRQEMAVKHLVSVLKTYRASGAAEDIFEQKEVIIQEPLRKLVVVPAGEGSNFRPYLPDGWECAEIEFSYEEILALGSFLWPEFTLSRDTDEPTEDGKGTENGGAAEGPITEKKNRIPPDTFRQSFIRWGDAVLRSVFREDSPGLSHTFESLLFFSCLTGKIPVLEEDAVLIHRQMEDCRRLWKEEVEAETASANLDAWEEKFLTKFISMHREGFFAERTEEKDLRKQILAFLAKLKKVREDFKPAEVLDGDWLEELDLTSL